MDSGGVPISEVVSSGDENGLRLLLASGADVNQTNKGGQTPLILAVVSGQRHLLPLLLKAGADPLLRDRTGLNAIQWAERKGLPEVVMLLERGSRVDPPKQKDAPETAERAAQEPNSVSPVPEASNREELSDVEKSRRWITGLKQRLDEKASREQDPALNPSGEPIRQSSYDVAPPRSLDVTANAPALEGAEPHVAAQDQDTSTPVSTHEVSSLELEPRRSRKKCPKCNTVYNSELVAYCAYHVVPLVDIDTPSEAGDNEGNKTPLLWLLVIVTFLGAALVGLFLFGPRGNPSVSTITPASSPAPVTTWKGTAIADSRLKTKVVELPPAYTVLKIDKPETVVVHVRIDSAGRVLTVQSPPGNEELRRAAMDAARKATFSADKLPDRETVGTITYTFNP